MTVEEIYLRLKDELTAENESSSSPERIFIKNEEQTICTLGMNRSHEIIFVEFKPSPKDLQDTEKEGFVHPHPVEMLHDAGWRQAQITMWEEAEKLLDIVHRSYKRKRPKQTEEAPVSRRGKKRARRVSPAGAPGEKARAAEKPAARQPQKAKKEAKEKPQPVRKPEPKKKAKAEKVKVKPEPKGKQKKVKVARPKPKAKPPSKKAKAAVKPKAKAKKKKR